MGLGYGARWAGNQWLELILPVGTVSDCRSADGDTTHTHSLLTRGQAASAMAIAHEQQDYMRRLVMQCRSKGSSMQGGAGPALQYI